MALADSVQALAAGSFVLARQRLELATLDVEEQLLRAMQILVRLLVAVALGTLALGALAATIVVGLWDTSRMAALVGVTAVFGACASWRAVSAEALRMRSTLPVMNSAICVCGSGIGRTTMFLICALYGPSLA